MEKNYVLLSGEDNSIIAPENEVFRCISDNFDCLWVKRDLFEKKDKRTFDDEEEAMDFYEDYEHFNNYDVIPIPPEGKYISVYCSDGNGVGEDPYFWDYDSHCYKWWDGSNWQTFTSDDIEELEIVNTITKNEPDFNCGRAVHYHIFKNKSDEYIVGFENDGYFHPISEEKRFTDKAKAIEYIENLIA